VKFERSISPFDIPLVKNKNKNELNMFVYTKVYGLNKLSRSDDKIGHF
jgi:hypothetical protein